MTSVAAFGVAGPLLPRLPSRLTPVLPAAGCAILALAYLATSALVAAGHGGDALLLAALGVGGFGLGLSSASLITHLTMATPTRYATDISGLISTNAQIWGAVGVAAVGTAYLSMAEDPGPGPGTHAFTVITACFGALALAASVASLRATRATESSSEIPVG